VARVGGPDPGRRAKVHALVRFPSVGLKTPSERFHWLVNCQLNLDGSG
jgi:hypothetical protein